MNAWRLILGVILGLGGTARGAPVLPKDLRAVHLHSSRLVLGLHCDLRLRSGRSDLDGVLEEFLRVAN